MYFSGQGRVYIASRDALGNPLAFKHVGNVPELSLELTTDTVEHKESRSGNRVVDQIITTGQKINLNLTLEEFNEKNFATALYGAANVVTGASVTAEALPTGLAIGDYAKLAHGKVSSLVIKDSAGSPLTLVSGTDYEANLDTGMVKFLTTPGTQPYKADYTYASTMKVNMFSQARKEYWLRFDGLNTADGNKPCTIDLYRVTLDPLSSLALITDTFAQFQLKGSGLYDDLKPNTGPLGKFGNLDFLDDTP